MHESDSDQFTTVQDEEEAESTVTSLLAVETPSHSTWRQIFSLPSMKGLLKSVIKSHPIKVLAGSDIAKPVFADDARMVALRMELAETLSTHPELQVEIDENGFASDNAIVKNFYQLLTVAGEVMNPVSMAPVDNTTLTEELNLVHTFITPRHKQIADTLFDAMMGRMYAEDLTFRKAASIGALHRSTDVVLKKTLVFRLFERFAEFKKLLLAGDLKAIAMTFQVVWIAILGLRLQPDVVDKVKDGVFKSKDREVNDYAYAVSGGKEGKRFPADKRVFKNGEELLNNFAMRARNMWQAAGVINSFLSAFMVMHRANYLHRFAFTWKHRSSAELVEKLKRFMIIIGVDVKQFDQSIPSFFIDYFVTSFERYWDPAVVEAMRLTAHTCYIQTDPTVNTRVPKTRFYGDPFDKSSFVHKLGLPSGVCWNPDFGKWYGTFVNLCMLDDHFGDVLEVGIERILKGQHDGYCILNSGDDAVLATNDPTFRVFLTKFFKEKKPYYLRVEPEVGVSFLGNVLYKTREGVLNACPNIVSFVVNTLVRERDIEHKTSIKTWHVGWKAKKMHFRLAPTYDIVYDIWKTLHAKHFDEDINARAEYAEKKYGDYVDISDPGQDNAVAIDVLLDDSKISYKYEKDDLPASIVDKYLGVVPFDTYERYIINMVKYPVRKKSQRVIDIENEKLDIVDHSLAQHSVSTETRSTRQKVVAIIDADESVTEDNYFDVLTKMRMKYAEQEATDDYL